MQSIKATDLGEYLKSTIKTVKVLGVGVGYLTADKSEVINSLVCQPECYFCRMKETTDAIYIGD